MCRSVYLPRSAVRPTISGRSLASATRACPNGAGLVFCPSAAIEAIMAEVLRRGFLAVSVAAAALMVITRLSGPVDRGARLVELRQGQIPFALVDADKVVPLACLEERHALAHQGVADDHARHRLRMVAGAVESRDQRLDVVAVDALGEPAERLPLVHERLGAEHVAGWA